MRLDHLETRALQVPEELNRKFLLEFKAVTAPKLLQKNNFGSDYRMTSLFLMIIIVLALLLRGPWRH